MSAQGDIHTEGTAPGLVFAEASVGYGGGDVLRGVGLSVAQGEFLGVVGPNGAGKSTLLRAITGEAKLTGGRIAVCGTPLDDLDPRERARTVGVVPQALPILFSFSASEFVAMGRHARLGRFQSPGSADAAAVEWAMELTDTSRLASMRVDTLSGGDMQRLTLAQALAQQPRVLLLDEATSHLDLNHRLQVLDVVKTLTTEGLAVLAVFHDLDLAARYSDRIAVISHGQLQAAGPPAEVITAEMLKDVFAVRAVVGTEPVTGSVSVTPVVRDQIAVKVQGPPAFVLGGTGAGSDLMRRLLLEGVHVVAGALNKGDVDQSVATALGIEHVALEPFDQMSESDEARVRNLAASSEVVVVCNVPFGRANIGNLRAAIDADRPILIVGDMSDDDRDFTDGEATRLLQRAVEGGAERVMTTQDALESIRGRLGHS